MVNFKSLSEIDEYYREWQKVTTESGARYCCPTDLGKGYVEIIGDISTAFVCVSDYVQYHNSLLRSYQKEQTISIAELQESNGQYYRNKDNIMSLEAGINCRINAMPTVLYSKIADNAPVKGTGFVIREAFLHANSIEQYSLEQMAYCLNEKPVYSKPLLLICKQLERIPVTNNLISLYLKAKAIEIISLLMNLTFEAKDKPRLSKDNLDNVKRAKEFLDSNYINPPGIEELASMFYINKNLLQSGFKNLTGHTVYEYIAYQKVSRSVELLLSTDMPIEAIADTVGYKSKMNFYNAFKKIFLITPNEMRKNHFGDLGGN